MNSRTNNTFSALSETFDVEDVAETHELVEIPNRMPADKSLDADADAVRDTLYSLLKKGEEAFDSLKKIAIAEESPRSFEVLNGILGSLSDIAGRLIDVHEKKAKIQKAQAPVQEVVNNGVVNNNTVFVGTTAELQDMLSKITMESE